MWVFSPGSWAAETLPRLLATPPLWDHGGAVADLDGDGRPDLAIVRQEGWGTDGFRYRIEVDLTTRGEPSWFSVSGAQGGLRIVPRDVDGDRNLDLVITSAWSLAPVGVWINDGHGGFTPGDPASYPRSIWAESSGISSDNPRQTLQATVPQSDWSWPDSYHGSHVRHELPFGRLTLSAAVSNPQRVTVRLPQTRAPPDSLLRQAS